MFACNAWVSWSPSLQGSNGDSSVASASSRSRESLASLSARSAKASIAAITRPRSPSTRTMSVLMVWVSPVSSVRRAGRAARRPRTCANSVSTAAASVCNVVWCTAGDTPAGRKPSVTARLMSPSSVSSFERANVARWSASRPRFRCSFSCLRSSCASPARALAESRSRLAVSRSVPATAARRVSSVAAWSSCVRRNGAMSSFSAAASCCACAKDSRKEASSASGAVAAHACARSEVSCEVCSAVLTSRVASSIRRCAARSV